MPLAAPLQQLDRTFVLFRGRKLSYFGGCDYFRMSSHPKVLRALHDGAEKFGLNVAASRFTTGNHVLFEQLEKELARFFGVESAALLSNGYAANLALAQSLAGRFTHALIDERSHGSILDASQLLHCPVRTFRHCDPGDLRKRVKSCGRSARPVLLSEGMFGQDGAIAPLREYLALLPRQALLLVDDAHGGGTVGRTGKGTPELCGIRDARLVQTISLSKAFGVYGGAILGSAGIIGAVRERSHIFKGNTPLPLPLANAALASIKVLKADGSLRRRLLANTSRIKTALHSTGLAVADNESPLVSIFPKSRPHLARIQSALLRAKVFPPLVHYGNEPRIGYFRFAISSEHTTAQLDALANALLASAR